MYSQLIFDKNALIPNIVENDRAQDSNNPKTPSDQETQDTPPQQTKDFRVQDESKKSYQLVQAAQETGNQVLQLVQQAGNQLALVISDVGTNIDSSLSLANFDIDYESDVTSNAVKQAANQIIQAILNPFGSGPSIERGGGSSGASGTTSIGGSQTAGYINP